MDVLAHPDPVVLERELVARVHAAHPGQSVGRTLVLVPNTRLARHVERRLTSVRQGWLGLEVLHFGALVRRILREAGQTAPRLLGPRLLEVLLRRVLAADAGSHWARFVHSRPGALGRLRAVLDDLREAWIDPARVASSSQGEAEQALAEVYRAYSAELERSLGRGCGDGAALAHAAAAHAGRFAASRTAIFLHGAYELIGVHLDLVRALDRARGVTVFAPFAPGAAATGYAERFASEFLAQAADVSPLAAADLERPALAALYDEAARPATAGGVRFSFRHAQGEAAEVRAAIGEALAAVRDGCPPEEIAVTARTLEPYAPALEQAFADAGIPWTSSLTSPLRREPRVRDFLLLLDVVRRDFPRRATSELLRSPRLHWKALGTDASPRQLAQADLWSRRARILGGLEEWSENLPRWAAQARVRSGQGAEERAQAEAQAERRAEEAREIARTLVVLRERVGPAPRTWRGHAEHLERLQRSLFRSSDDAATAAADELSAILEEMAALEHAAGEREAVGFDEMLAWLGEAVDSAAPPLHRGDEGGIRVLDALELRGMTFCRLHLLGVNSGILPRRPREDPILTDRLRAKLRRTTRRPLTLGRASADEERLLLALTVGAATESADISWQRADESGRSKTPSLALRELARLATGRPEVLSLALEHVPSHPAQALEHLVGRHGQLSADEGLLLAALRSRGSAAIASLGERHPALAPGIAMLGATQGFRIVDPAYDGRVGPDVSSGELSVSALETLGRCPLQFFFRHVLRVPELDAPASAFGIEPKEVGVQIHDLLERLYRTLLDEGGFDGRPLADVQRRAREWLAGERPRLLGDLGERFLRRLPVLGERIAEEWFEAVAAFTDADLAWLDERGLVPSALEQPRSTECSFGGATVRISARFDRVVPRDGGALIGDYKTSGDLADRVNPTLMLKAAALQVPLYGALAGAGAAVELLGVGPTFLPEGEEYRFRFEGFPRDEARRGFEETMGVLLDLRARGVFALSPDQHCDWCPYRAACRRNHPPTIDREQTAEDSADYRLLRKKSARDAPLLASLRGRS